MFPSIILVNALGQSSALWNDLISRLPVSMNPQLYSPNLNVKYLDQVEELKLLVSSQKSEVIMVGWCTGPKMMLRVAAALPHCVKSLFFAAPSFRGPGRSSDFDTMYERDLEQLLLDLRKRPEIAPRIASILKARSSYSSSDFSPLDLVFYEPQTLLDYAKVHLDFWHDDPLSDPDVQTLQIPIYILAGRRDNLVSSYDLDLVRNTFPNVRTITFDSGHYLLHDQASLIVDLIVSSS